MFPGVHAQNRLHVDGPRGQTPRVCRVRPHRPRVLITLRRVLGVRGHVDRLPAGVCGRVRRAGIVRAEDVDETLPLEVLRQPHESRPEHAVGCREEVEFQGFHRRACVDDILAEFLGDFDLLRGLFFQLAIGIWYLVERLAHQRVKKEVVVMGHRRIVEHGRHLWPSRVLDQQIRRLHLSVHSICKSQPDPLPSPQYIYIHILRTTYLASTGSAFPP